MTDTKTIQQCYNLINKYFNNNPHKTWLWFQTSNPSLGCVTPLYMIKVGRANKLLKFIKGQMEGNLP